MKAFHFEPCRLPEETRPLREEVRQFLDEHLRDYPLQLRAYTWTGYDPEFSRKVGERGWIGMTWPKTYGGSERSALERYVVLEEMLAAGAPVGAHWVGDRQSGPLLLRYGTEEQRRRLLPAICRGEIFFCIGMSEPDSGSDLASIRARAERADGGWRINGTKLWTSGAQRCGFMIALFRTGTDPEDRHAGLSQFIVPLDGPGITIRPIRDLSGNDHFCEVVFEDAPVPEDAIVGNEGDGWMQVITELAFERSGPERYLSCYPLLSALLGELGDKPGERSLIGVGRQLAHLATLRNMSISVAGLIEAGESPALEACVVKDLGGVFEQALPGFARSLLDVEPRADEGGSEYQQALALLTQIAPSFSLRGGTREILRGIIARGLGLR
ncbi:MAG: acyl-CoA dehydrogenase family protein [Deltaproteobacteria bacterium]|nr:acyl-CoA dehydrogenase family protein [Deltaproteobacteria bacterium]